MNGPNWKLEDDRQTVTITFPSEPIVELRYGLAAIEDMIRHLGEMRASMLPEVAATYPMGQRVEAVRDPPWVTEPDVMMGDSLLHLRDPRYGWLHYLIPKPEAAKLAGYLQAQVEGQPSTSPPGKPN
jgi:hypothetical protein